MENPFVLQPYKNAELFCDREKETQEIIDDLLNGVNVTLISPRRYGKTGLIYHVFNEIARTRPSITLCYCDIYAADCLDGFIKLLSESILASTKTESLIKKFFSTLSGIRPLVSYDPISGAPQVSITYQNDGQKQTTLKNIFDFLGSQKKHFIIAFDEFQIIRNFKGVNMEALLRTYMQPLKNVRFVFCGSQKHVMADMFVNEKSPFYESTHIVYLDKINPEIYAVFIKKLFGMDKRHIDDETINFILEWCRCHTFYVQYLCHRIFRNGSKDITLNDVRQACSEILNENINGFLERRNLLTDKQWQFMKAVAKEGTVSQPTAGNFINKYKLGTSAAVKRILTSLIEKELLLETLSLEGKNYSVYNVFLSRWMETI